MINKKRFIKVLALFLSVLLLLTGCSNGSVTETATSTPQPTAAATKTPTATPAPTPTATPTPTPSPTPEPTEAVELTGMELQVLDVGQGLCVLLKADGQCMLYDGGGRSASSYVVSYLQQQDVTEIDTLVTSHYDEDHIAGQIGVMKSGYFTVDTILNPDYTADTDIYESYMEAAEGSKASVIHPDVGYTFTVGGAEVTVIGPSSYTAEDENDRSIAIRIVYGETSYIITGDTETEGESAILRSKLPLDSDLLVVGHHGSSTSTSDRFMNSVRPTYAVISCGAGNSYGHPTQETLNTLEEYSVTLYRTDVQGEIIAHSDGKTIWFDEDACTDWTPGAVESIETEEPAETVEPTTEESDATGDEQTYILNTNTHKFHYPYCSSVDQMSDKNKWEYTGTREEIIAMGYDPCGRCNP